ncbi:hypothetical protein HHK36_021300 [Tetracentron sinense]|uniref:Trafficking protein particle complex subunit n=1 Tax=Tetracentron sinense TaxID=13715 RepID=A0A834YPH3_TETSI|nr:hypothetical protein HHK36_021300 [Tetracentron sinense]
MIGVGKIKQHANVLDKPLSKGKQEVSLSAFALLFSELVQYNQTQVDNIAEFERRLEDAGYTVGARVLELLCHRDKVSVGFQEDGFVYCLRCLFISWEDRVSDEVDERPNAVDNDLNVDKPKETLQNDERPGKETEGRHNCWGFCPLYTIQYGRCYLERSINSFLSEMQCGFHEVNEFFFTVRSVTSAADSLEKGTEHEDEYMISEKELLVNRFISIPKDMGTFNCGAFVAGIVRGVLDGAGFPAIVTAHFVPMEGQQRPRTTILIKFAEEVNTVLSLFSFHFCIGFEVIPAIVDDPQC